MSTLDTFKAEILAADAARARSQQTDPGASQTYSCRAETVLRANGIAETDQTDSWSAIVGTAIHAMWENAADRDALTEYRTTYRGVPATVDRWSKAVLTDLKTKADEAAIAKVKTYGPSDDQVGQIMLGAAGLIAEGRPVETVELLYVPRSGSLDDAYLWSAPFDQALADKAADWHEEVRSLIAERKGLSAAEQVDGLQDQPPSWCYTYCGHVTACRGVQERPQELDPLVMATADEYLAADAAEKQAKSAKDNAKKFLASYDDLRAAGLRWQGGGTRYEQAEDIDLERIKEEYRTVIGELPVKTFEREISSPRSLRKTK